MIASFVDGETLYFEEQEEGGQILCAKDADPNLSVFSPDERMRLAEVVEFVDGFNTATALTNISHKEPIWSEADNGDLLSYKGAISLKAF